MLCLLCHSGGADFQLVSDGHQENAQKLTPPIRRCGSNPADDGESTSPRNVPLHKQPPALLPKPFSRLPNHIAGESHLPGWTLEALLRLRYYDNFIRKVPNCRGQRL